MTESSQPRPLPETNRDAIEFLEEQHVSFLEDNKTQPIFRIACLAANKQRQMLPEFIDTNSPEVINLLKNPRQRESGWNFAGPNELTPTLHGIEKKKDWRHFEVWRNGYFVFSTPMNSMFCWKHEDYGEQAPVLLNPIVVFEYTHSWISLCIRLLKLYIEPKRSDNETQLIVDFRLYNCKGFKLRSGTPGSIFYDFHVVNGGWAQQHLFLPKYSLQLGSTANPLVQALMLRLYNAFGLEAKDMPNLLDENGSFLLPRSKNDQ